MQFSTSRGALLAALARAARIVEKSTTIPILSNILLETTKDQLTITATDLDLAVTIAVEAQATSAGAVTVPGRHFHDLVKRLPETATISAAIDAAAGQLKLSAGRSRFAVPTLPATDYPSLQVPKAEATFSLAAGDLARLIERTEWAICTEETRYYLAGVYFHTCQSAGETVLRAVATDGLVLGHVETPAPEGAAGMPGIIVPTKAIRELARLAADHRGEIRIEISATKLEAAAGDTTLSTKLIDGTFPDYARVVPSGGERVLTIETKTIRAALDRVALAALADKSNHRSVKLALEEGRLALSASSVEHGSAEEEIEADFAGEPLEIGFSARLLDAAIAAADADRVRIEFIDAGSPALIRPDAQSPDRFVAMPRRA